MTFLKAQHRSFQTGSPTMQTLPISYSYGLVSISVLLSITAAYAAFGLADRMRQATTRPLCLGWLAGGSLAMGIGIWSMHYLGMLALRLPVPVAYYAPTVVLSLVLAVVASAIALVIACVPHAGWKHQLTGGVLMGTGIGAMHYVGMSAMRSSAMHVYSPGIVALSVVTAVVISTVALRTLGRVREAGQREEIVRVGAGALMGLGIASMHYLSMRAVHFVPDAMPVSLRYTMHIDSLGEIGVVLAATVVLLIALVSAALDKRMYVQLRKANAELAESRAALLESESRLRELNQMLSELSIRDGLTGIHNRRHFDERLEIEWRRAMRSEQPLSLLMLDVDHFKRLNDTYGHPYGDQCLRQIAKMFDQQHLRVEDLSARIGGEEFAILLPCTGTEGAQALAESIRRDVQAMVLKYTITRPTTITISIGVSTCIPHAMDSPTTFFASADRALYEAKRSGRNRVHVAPPFAPSLPVAIA